MFYDDFLKLADSSEELTFEQVPFNHPLFIMYSSGTTGKPKCLVHSVGVRNVWFGMRFGVVWYGMVILYGIYSVVWYVEM